MRLCTQWVGAQFVGGADLVGKAQSLSLSSCPQSSCKVPALGACPVSGQLPLAADKPPQTKGCPPHQPPAILPTSPPTSHLPPCPYREERRLFQQEWLVDQQEAALETQRAHLQAQLGLDPTPERPRQAVGQWEGQPHAPPAAAGGGQHPHGLPFLPPVWEDIDAPGALEQAGRLRGDSSSSSGYESGDEGGPGVAVPPPGGAEPRHD